MTWIRRHGSIDQPGPEVLVPAQQVLVPGGDRPKAAMSSSPEVDSDFASEISLGAAVAPPAAGEQTGDLDLADRHALRRVTGLSTELTDVTEVEYRALRLERVVLVGVWTEGTLDSAENS